MAKRMIIWPHDSFSSPTHLKHVMAKQRKQNVIIAFCATTRSANTHVKSCEINVTYMLQDLSERFSYFYLLSLLVTLKMGLTLSTLISLL